MKKIYLSIPIVFLLLNTSFAQSFGSIGKRTNAQLEQDKLYEVMIGTNLTNASYNKTDGFSIDENEIKIVGFLHRYNKIEYDRIYIKTMRDTTVIDEQTMKGRSINGSWRDFYIKLKNVIYSDNYSIEIYSEPERKLIESKTFYIKKKA